MYTVEVVLPSEDVLLSAGPKSDVYENVVSVKITRWSTLVLYTETAKIKYATSEWDTANVSQECPVKVVRPQFREWSAPTWWRGSTKLCRIFCRNCAVL